MQYKIFRDASDANVMFLDDEGVLNPILSLPEITVDTHYGTSWEGRRIPMLTENPVN
jgi:hypothetical protein